MSSKTQKKNRNRNTTSSTPQKKRFRAPWDTTEDDSFGRLLFGVIVNPLTLGVVAIIVACVIWLGPKDTSITVLDRTWARNIPIEDWRNVLGEGWDYPAGAEVTSKARKFYKYVKVEDSSASLGYHRRGGHTVASANSQMQQPFIKNDMLL